MVEPVEQMRDHVEVGFCRVVVLAVLLDDGVVSFFLQKRTPGAK